MADLDAKNHLQKLELEQILDRSHENAATLANGFSGVF